MNLVHFLCILLFLSVKGNPRGACLGEFVWLILLTPRNPAQGHASGVAKPGLTKIVLCVRRSIGSGVAKVTARSR